MDDGDIDRVLFAQLVGAASVGLEQIAAEVAGLYDGWRAQGAPDASVDWLRSVIERLGWWSGRLAAEADPELLARFPQLDL